MMCQCRFTDLNSCVTTLCVDGNDGKESCAYMWTGSIREISVPATFPMK